MYTPFASLQLLLVQFTFISIALFLTGCDDNPAPPHISSTPPTLSNIKTTETLRLKQAQKYAHQGAHHKAISSFQKIISTQPKHSQAYLGLAQSQLKVGQSANAIATCKQGLGQDSTTVSLYNILSAAYASEGRYSKAIRSLEKALILQPESPLTHLNLGGLHTRLGQYEEATHFLIRARHLAPQEQAIRRRLGELFLNTNQPDSACAEFATALKIDPQSETLHFLYGKALASAGDDSAALIAYNQARHLDPGFSEAQYHTALAARQQDQTSLADSAFTAYKQLQLIGQKNRNLLKKLTALRAAILDSPEEPLHHFQLGLFFTRNGYNKQGFNRFNRVLQLNPNEYFAHNHMGSILLRNKKPDTALEFFENALEIAPNFVPAHINAGNALMLLNRPTQAVSYYSTASRLAPQTPMVWNYLAQSYLQLNQLEAAENAAHQGLAVSGKDHKIRRLIEHLLEEIKHQQE